MQRHLWLGTAVMALIFGVCSPAAAQYLREYKYSTKPSVEINLDALNDKDERDYEEQHSVVAEPLPVAPPPVMLSEPELEAVPAPMPEPVAVEQPRQQPQQLPPRKKKRLLKPVLTARPPVQLQQRQAEEPRTAGADGEMPIPPPVVKRSVIMAADPDDTMADEMEAEIAAKRQAQAPIAAAEPISEPVAEPVAEPIPVPSPKPKTIKRSWSVVDGTPPPEEMRAPAPTPVAIAPEPAPAPVVEEVAETPAEMPAPVVAEAPVVETPTPAPRHYATAPSDHIPAQPVVMQHYKPSPSVVDEQQEAQAPLPHRKPAAFAPAPEVAAPVIAETPAPTPAPVAEVAAPIEQPEEAVATESAVDVAQPETDSMPVVPTLADLTLGFNGSSSDLTAESQKKLDNVIRQMADSIAGRLQVRGYASADEGGKTNARRIALSRALAVRSYLMDKGIKPNRVDVSAKGAESDRQPLDRVDLIFAR